MPLEGPSVSQRRSAESASPSSVVAAGREQVCVEVEVVKEESVSLIF